VDGVPLVGQVVEGVVDAMKGLGRTLEVHQAELLGEVRSDLG